MMNVAVVVATQKGMLAQGHALPAWIRLLEEKMGNVREPLPSYSPSSFPPPSSPPPPIEGKE